jgi:hypothetical protein
MATKPRSRKRRTASVDASAVHSPTLPVDPEVEREFIEAGAQASGTRKLAEKLRQHNSTSPELSAGDPDAAWDRADVGEECAGGSTPTPDQEVVEEIGEAMGLTFEDNEPVDAPGKLRRRDRKRWELEPASSEDFEERQAEIESTPTGKSA